MFKARFKIDGAYVMMAIYFACILMVVAGSICGVLGIKHRIEDKGLKSIVERIWYGKEVLKDNRR